MIYNPNFLFSLFIFVCILSSCLRLENYFIFLFGIISFSSILFKFKDSIKISEYYLLIFLSIISINCFLLFEAKPVITSISFIFIFSILIFILNLKISAHDAHLVLKLSIFFWNLICFDCFYQFYSGNSILGYGMMSDYKITGPFPNTYVDTLGIIMFFCIIALQKLTTCRIYKIFLSILLFITLIVILLSVSRSAIFLLITQVLVSTIVFIPRKSFYIFSISFIVCLIVFQLVYFLSPDEMSRFITKVHIAFDIIVSLDFSADVNNSTTHRILIWREIFDFLFCNPLYLISGTGFGSFPSLIALFDMSNAILGVPDAQSVVLDIVLSSGVLGSISFILFLFFLFKRLKTNCSFTNCMIFNLCFWFLNPLSVQHKFEANWFLLQIVFSLLLAHWISVTQKRFYK